MEENGAGSAPIKISFGLKKAVPGIGQGPDRAGRGKQVAKGNILGEESASASKEIGSSSGRNATAKTRISRIAFDNDDDDDAAAATEDRSAEASTAYAANSKTSTRADDKTRSASTNIAGAAPMSRAQKQRLESAMELDASINDYDSVYDAMKAGERAAATKREGEKKRRDPKYMDGYLASAEQRKIDRQRAESKKIQREREAEGDEFADKESFVTEAYKQQMEEMRAAENKEKQRDEQDRRKSRGVAGFYKDLLADQDRVHQEAVSAALRGPHDEQAAAKSMGDGDTDANRDLDAQRRRIEDAKKMGLDVRINDDNEVVDERSLLSAGLNYIGKQKPRAEEKGAQDRHHHEQRSHSEQGRQRGYNHDGAAQARALREAQRARQSRQMEEQLLAVHRQREEAEHAEMERRKAAMMGRREDVAEPEASSSTNNSASDRIAEAKRRAMERKRLREESQT